MGLPNPIAMETIHRIRIPKYNVRVDENLFFIISKFVVLTVVPKLPPLSPLLEMLHVPVFPRKMDFVLSPFIRNCHKSILEVMLATIQIQVF